MDIYGWVGLQYIASNCYKYTFTNLITDRFHFPDLQSAPVIIPSCM